MKKNLLLVLMCVLLALPASGMGEIGFAEVKKNEVNMRQEPNGKIIVRLDAPQSVFVFEEKQVKGQLWCHVYTYKGKNTADGWIRSDMLRFVSEEFTDMAYVQAGDHYVTGIRRDGSAAIMGDDMPHMPCIDAVRTWQDVKKITSSTCAAYAITNTGWVMSKGRNNEYGTWQAADISGREPVLLDEDGCIMEATWGAKESLSGWMPQEARWMQFAKVIEIDRIVYGGLTRDGQIVWFKEESAFGGKFVQGPYTDIDMYFYHVAALRADGRVETAIRANAWADDAVTRACVTDHWQNVVQVAAGEAHTLGLKQDGTVYYAGADHRHREQVESWTDIAQIAAGNGYSIALKKDGSIVMAGAYTSYEH
ncbi:MAG: hypothetical protein IKU38_06005 [Clostridia bacterium]|nr:hypothetical protein [Clostridia bacterium]